MLFNTQRKFDGCSSQTPTETSAVVKYNRFFSMQQHVTLSKLMRFPIENKDRPGMKICIYLDLSFLSSSSVKTMHKTAQFFLWGILCCFSKASNFFLIKTYSIYGVSSDDVSIF